MGGFKKRALPITKTQPDARVGAATFSTKAPASVSAKQELRRHYHAAEAVKQTAAEAPKLTPAAAALLADLRAGVSKTTG